MCRRGFTCFPQVNAFLSSEDVEIGPVKSIVETHMANLIGAFLIFTPLTAVKQESIQLDRARFLLSEAHRRTLPVSHQEKQLDLSCVCGLQMKSATSTLTAVLQESQYSFLPNYSFSTYSITNPVTFEQVLFTILLCFAIVPAKAGEKTFFH